MTQKTTFDKIADVVMPLIVYLFIMLFAQAGFTIFVMVMQVNNVNIDGVATYSDSLGFVENMNKIIVENSLLVTFISAVVAIPILIYMFKKENGSLSTKKINNDIWYTIPVGVLASVGISKLVTILPIDGVIGNYSEISSNVMANNIWLQIVTLIILGPFMEELLFRGLIYNRLKKISDSSIAAYVSAIIFGVYHLNLVQGIYTFIIGILLVFVYEKYNSLWAPYMLHMAANAMAVIINYLPISVKINNYWYIKLPVMIIEVAILAMVVYKFMYKKNTDN